MWGSLYVRAHSSTLSVNRRGIVPARLVRVHCCVAYACARARVCVRVRAYGTCMILLSHVIDWCNTNAQLSVHWKYSTLIPLVYVPFCLLLKWAVPRLLCFSLCSSIFALTTQTFPYLNHQICNLTKNFLAKILDD